ncbi:MAG: protein translocase subunit SecD [Candidatus Omnitrophica bacterium]|jgi:SecD/SecF fusion protein|nr:protein translocase subunit SecD [Candidatus Omnitrophota bacterium]
MIRNADLKIRYIIIGALVIFSALAIYPLNKKINLGLDLKGGMYVLLRADTSSVPAAQVNDAMNGAIEKVRTRIDSFGVKETSIQIQGDNSILVQLPGVVDREIITKLREVGKLEFNLVEEDKEKFEAAVKGSVPAGYELKDYKGAILIRKGASLVGADLAQSSVGFDQYGTPNVRLQFTAEGAKKFAKVTEENVGKQLAIILDGKVMSAPAIREAIMSGQAEITGDFTLDESRTIVSVLNSGALPVPLVVEEERTVGPLLGSDSITKGINACLLGAALVFIFMLAYYFMGGVVADICLVFNILFTLAALNILKATLTLPGIAGMILALGMAVDANVLIFERIRDELTANKPLGAAIKNSFDRTFLTIFDSNLTTIIAAAFLFIFGTGPIRGFATTLILGILISMFTAIFVGKTIFATMLKGGLKKMPMLQFFPASKIDFLKPRYICLVFSTIVIAVSMYGFLSKGEAVYSIDFKGGQVLEYKLTPAPAIEDVRKILLDAGFSGLTIQDFKDVKGGINIKSKEDIADKTEEVLKKNYKEVVRLRVDKVGPTVGALLKTKALWAIILSLIGILTYVFIRFKHFDFALAGVIALLHDVLIALGFCALFGYEVDLLIVTALLTIAGYSINDTIVIYDRIREIAPRMHKASTYQILNQALNNTFSRTIITSLTVFFVTLAMYLLGGQALKGFSFVLLVGFISGVYSTIYVASALVLVFRGAKA